MDSHVRLSAVVGLSRYIFHCLIKITLSSLLISFSFFLSHLSSIFNSLTRSKTYLIYDAWIMAGIILDRIKAAADTVRYPAITRRETGRWTCFRRSCNLLDLLMASLHIGAPYIITEVIVLVYRRLFRSPGPRRFGISLSSALVTLLVLSSMYVTWSLNVHLASKISHNFIHFWLSTQDCPLWKVVSHLPLSFLVEPPLFFPQQPSALASKYV